MPGRRKDFEQAKASRTSGVVQQGTVTIPSATLAHPSGPSVSLAVQGTSQSGNNDNPDQPATSVVTATSQTQSVTLPASTVQASNNFPFGMGSIHPLGYSMAPTPQYPLLQSTTQQSTMTHVHTGSLSSGLPHQSVSYVMPSQSNASQANDLMGFDPISSIGYSIPQHVPQQYWSPQPLVQQSAGGQVYPGQLVNVSSYQPGAHGVPAQSSGAISADSPGIHLKKMSLPTFSGQRKDWPEFKIVWKQLAEGAIKNKTALAHELKRSVKGEAGQRMKSVYVTKPEAYDTMWKKLEDYYDDTSTTVQAALEDLHKLKPVSETDYRGLVEFVDVVESSYSQLEELNQLNTLTMRDIDFVNGLLPNHLRLEWIRKYHDMSQTEKIQPFKSFMKFLEREREAVA